MPTPKSRKIALAVAMLIVGIGIVIGTSFKAHQYYYPLDGFGQRVTEPEVVFTADRPGRYEIHSSDDLGDLTLDVVRLETMEFVPSEPFGPVTELFHTSGQQGHAFTIESPGDYQLAAEPWTEETELFLDFQNTQAIALWTLVGMAVGGLNVGFAFLLLISILASRGEVEGPSSQNSGDGGEVGGESLRQGL